MIITFFIVRRLRLGKSAGDILFSPLYSLSYALSGHSMASALQAHPYSVGSSSPRRQAIFQPLSLEKPYAAGSEFVFDTMARRFQFRRPQRWR